uniref:Uncharacterized protein n=1 Tax=Glossina palpalis gambiensis TaxID=67801 RepID=A0A1B0AL04_9MUSC
MFFFLQTQIATILIIFLTSIGFLAIRCKLIDPAVPLDARRNYPLDFIFQTTVNPFSLPVSVKQFKINKGKKNFEERG